MSAIVADTHAVLWSLFDPIRLSRAAQAAIDGATQAGSPIYVATISVVEVIYLVEKGRLPLVVLTTLMQELSDPQGNLVPVSLDLAIAHSLEAIPRDAVPDMPDRIIAATALYLGLPLVTRDAKIRSANVTTIW